MSHIGNIYVLLSPSWSKYEINTLVKFKLFLPEFIDNTFFYWKTIFRPEPERHINRYLKNDVLKSIVDVIKHANFQLYRLHPDRVI